ncbi:RNA polymerase sigma factor [Streptomyces sp. A0958]|uniref:RNA polymerase sigma factor n=1 Tax=Streptomyces sp. A0958 TaxID=2563101 RepID=UPI00109E5CE6|nr:RNA polymerase sigma factor [Streptomyces sp. A0958]THA57420.1 RNA polymerase sigma factor [Streptomyces sp. A0958]
MTHTEDAGGLRRRLREGDRETFAGLYDDYARTVYNHALRLTGDWSAAEDVMSETFLAAWRTRDRLEPEGGSVRPWLLGIATHKAENANRSRRRRLAFLARQPQPPSVADFAPEAAGRIDDARRLAAVHAALGKLRRHEREVLALCVWSGLDYAEAAQALDIPIGTVRSRLARARARLSRLSEEKTEPWRPRGEAIGRAALAALPVREETP